jgi:hypothetical protein
MRNLKQWLVPLAVLAFFFCSLTGAHLHLCFDGSEPPLSLHAGDGAHFDHHAGESQQHDDVDVEPLGDLLAKSAQALLFAIMAVSFVLLVLQAPPSKLITIARQRLRVPRAPPRFLRPPLRAPPI